jgi:hypothetical protein
MKNSFFTTFLLLLITFHLSAQDCEVETDPVSPIPNITCKSSIHHKNFLRFYAVEGVKDSLILRVEFEDLYRRVIYVGDSAIIRLKNGHKIKLLNNREYVAYLTKMNLLFESIDMYLFAHTAWITKKDVEILSQNRMETFYFHSKINEIVFTKEDSHKKKHINYTYIPKIALVFKSKLRQLAKCALTL